MQPMSRPQLTTRDEALERVLRFAQDLAFRLGADTLGLRLAQRRLMLVRRRVQQLREAAA